MVHPQHLLLLCSVEVRELLHQSLHFLGVQIDLYELGLLLLSWPFDEQFQFVYFQDMVRFMLVNLLVFVFDFFLLE